MIPVMCVALGVQMSEIYKIKINFNVYSASSLRLVRGPIIVLFGGIFSLGEIKRSSLIFQSTISTAVLVPIIALEYKQCPEFVTTTVFFSTKFSIFTLTIFLTLV